jgi:hypothetical protein
LKALKHLWQDDFTAVFVNKVKEPLLFVVLAWGFNQATLKREHQDCVVLDFVFALSKYEPEPTCHEG